MCTFLLQSGALSDTGLVHCGICTSSVLAHFQSTHDVSNHRQLDCLFNRNRNAKTPHYWHFVRETICHWWIPISLTSNPESVSMSWRHHIISEHWRLWGSKQWPYVVSEAVICYSIYVSGIYDWGEAVHVRIEWHFQKPRAVGRYL